MSCGWSCEALAKRETLAKGKAPDLRDISFSAFLRVLRGKIEMTNPLSAESR